MLSHHSFWKLYSHLHPMDITLQHDFKRILYRYVISCIRQCSLIHNHLLGDVLVRSPVPIQVNLLSPIWCTEGSSTLLLGYRHLILARYCLFGTMSFANIVMSLFLCLWRTLSCIHVACLQEVLEVTDWHLWRLVPLWLRSCIYSHPYKRIVYSVT